MAGPWYVNEARATGSTTNTWTVATTASTSQVAADVSRVFMTINNTSSGRVYLRFDSSAPTSTAYHWFLEAGDRYEVPPWLTTQAVSMLGAVAAGTVVSLLATA